MRKQQQGGAAVAGARARNSSRERGGAEAGLEPSVKLDPHMEMCIEAYGKLNTLMQEFIDHVSLVHQLLKHTVTL